MRVAYNMFTVIDTFKIGDNLSVTLDGECEQLKNGVTLKGRAGNKYKVLSVGMTHFNNSTDITRSTIFGVLHVAIYPKLKRGILSYI